MTRSLRLGLLALPLLVVACGAPVDLKQAVEVVDVSTGWHDGGIVDGKNRLVPSATFRIRKKDADASLDTIALNMAFRIDGEADNFEDVFVQRVEFGPDNQTAPLTVRPETGYTGDPPQSRAEMLKNSFFRDMELRIFARQSSSQWVELHQVKIERRLLAN
jgi:hypothetical protein